MMGNFGDRMKEYERIEASRQFIPLLPVCARLDGKSFKRFTKGLDRPYDRGLVELMIATATYLVQETQANMGYTQSDEISLVWYSGEYKSQIFFNRRIQKMVSILASMATACFNTHLSEYIPEKSNYLALFDCRAWQAPTLEEAANTFLWRELDATKNSISMAARCHYSHKALHGKKGSEMQEMLWQKGVNWNDYPGFFKRGTFIQKHRVYRKFTPDEIRKFPEQHQARNNPDLKIERSTFRRLEMPPFSKVRNRVDVIFNGAEPLLDEFRDDLPRNP